MKTKVVNIKYIPLSWTNDQSYVYIGRAGKGMDGYFGNPIAVGKKCQICGNIHIKGVETLACYFEWLCNRLRTDKEFVNSIKRLSGKKLVCFCKPEPCHGDILVEFIEEFCSSKKTN